MMIESTVNDIIQMSVSDMVEMLCFGFAMSTAAFLLVSFAVWGINKLLGLYIDIIK